ncbi:MAG: NAD(P)/FAD-dependent oxidoreductase [Chloroflexi bacterium]|nr:NAD(P)/FAD-dependent oxidoreductase [Chloroflexota bacterium]
MGFRVIVIGAGPAGLVAAGRAAERGADVLLVEKTHRPGSKLLLTGNSRCNITNTMDLEGFITMFGPNGRFLRSSFYRFFREELLALLGRYGLTTKVEPDGRVFPVTDSAQDVLQALRRYGEEYGVKTLCATRITAVDVSNGGVTRVRSSGKPLEASRVIMACGGASYPATGSTGDGYPLAGSVGHTIVPVRPALVPLIVRGRDMMADIQGIGLHNVRITAYQPPSADDVAPMVHADFGRGIQKKPPRGVIESRTGDIMFTHFGLGGPATLLISLGVVDALKDGPVAVSIDHFPQLEYKVLSQMLQRELDSSGKRLARNTLASMLPEKLGRWMMRAAGVPQDMLASQVSAGMRARLLGAMKSLSFRIEGPLSLETAFVTAGGVSLDEIDPRTMQSRLVEGLFFAGEVMDLDAATGGYNLQAAFSTGWVAGESCMTGA